MIWRVFDASGNVVAEIDDLYEAEMLAESIGGRFEMMM